LEEATVPVRRRVALQRVGLLAGLPALLADLGYDEADVFSELGIDAEDLRAENRIPYFLFLRILDRAVEVTGRRHLGLLLGSGQAYTALGSVGRLMGVAPDLGSALADFARWHITASHSAAAFVDEVDGELLFGYGIYEFGTADASALYDCAAAFGCRLVRDLTGRADVIREVRLCRRRPVDVAPYEKALGPAVTFDSPVSAIVLPRAAAALPLADADPEAHAAIERDLSERFRSVLADDVVRLRHVMRPLLHQARAVPYEAARRMGTSEVVLHDRLARAGTSFDRVREEVSHAVACELLAFTDMPLEDVAHALAFRDLAGFDAVFQGVAGVSPDDWRAAFSDAERT
jgi:AraC-like DNA-binding protein